MNIIKCTFLASAVKLVLCYGQIDTVHNGSDIRWRLPSVADCKGYSLINPSNVPVITIYDTQRVAPGVEYTDRCSWSFLNNGTVVLTLSNVQYSDEGTYLIYPSVYCPYSYSLSVIRNFDGIAFWQNWGPWSNCNVTCGYGSRTRQRDCSIADHCYSGAANEVSHCKNDSCNASSKNVLMLTRGDVVSSPVMFTSRVMHNSGFITAYVTTTLQIVLNPNYGFVQPKERIFEIPLSAIVGTGAAVIIGVLLIVMCVLVRRFRKRAYGYTSDRNCGAKTIKNNQTEAKSQHSSLISDRGVSRDSVYHIYNEIADDDVKSEITVNERNSVVTMDNNYVGLPKYCMPVDQQIHTNEPTATYINTLGSVKLFCNTSSAEVKKYRKDNSENFVKESKSFFNPDSSTQRHQSTDNTSYLVPGPNRVKRIPLAYTKK